MKLLVSTMKHFAVFLLLFSSFISFGNTYIVDNAANTDNLAVYSAGDGTNTLIKCVRLANANPGLDNINFNLPGVAPFIISLAAGAPLIITSPVFLDGFTQSGASAGNLLIQIKGNNTDVLRLNASSDGSTIRGLVIYGGANAGINITNSGTHTIIGNYIGTSVTGTAVGPTTLQTGISLSGALNCVIGGTGGVNTRNIISGNTQRGIYIQASSNGTTIQGNYIGATATGLAALANGSNGIDIASSNNITVGGTTYASRNIISGNASQGINVQTCTTLIIQGNFIGLGVDGKTAIKNNQNGINLQSPTSTITIGGLVVPARNIISANGSNGIQATGCTGITFQNNYIGVDSTGLTAQANAQSGINFINTAASTNITIGGSTYTTRNIISGNAQQGINMQSCSSITIQGNFIGLGVDGKTAIKNSQNGINLQNPTSTVTIGGLTIPARNIISANGSNGVQATGCTGITFQNNYIGVDSTGLTAQANAQSGINFINNTASANITIGGSTYTARNIISGNTNQGINMQNCSSLTIQGNFIGLGVDGTTAIKNSQNGINLQSPTSTVAIGGLTLQERNIISSNSQTGLLVSGSTGITVQNNYIGVDSTGLLLRGNQSGINISGSTTLLIGGASYNARNIVSGSTGSNGISISTCSTSVVIQGNFVGLAADGKTAYGNKSVGISISNSTPITIGGPSLAQRNIISGNTSNAMNIGNCPNTTIQNNYIGVDSTGLLLRGNQSGISVSGSNNLLIGGSSYNTRNIVSGSTAGTGINISTCSTSVVIQGNFIGLAADGTTPYGNNGGNGLLVQTSTPVTIGGTTLAQRNVVSNNSSVGISVNSCPNTSIQNNYVGVDSTGMLVRGNGNVGISVSSSPNIIIGNGSASSGNIVSNNGANGILINSTCSLAVVKGNIIGLAVDGTTSMPNKGQGIEIDNSFKPTIGGLTLPERNLISTNLDNGIVASSADSITIRGNYIGVDVTGLLNKGNGQNGININTSKGVVIGGSTFSARNIVSGNGQDGIIIGGASPGAIIKANFAGIGADGKTVIPNVSSGIRLYVSSTSNGALIGGSLFAERNVSSGNGTSTTSLSRDGIRIEGGSGHHIIKGNYCGIDSSGTIAMGNGWAGISVNENNGTIIGGTGTYEGNICTANLHEGMYLRNDTNCVVIGNFIGTDKTASLSMGNGRWGIHMDYACYLNVIGGDLTQYANIITNTVGVLNTDNSPATPTGSGVYIQVESASPPAAKFNRIVRNQIYCNYQLGILLDAGVNENIAAPVITASSTSLVSGTGSIAGDSIHVYLNPVCNDCEGKVFLGATTVTAGGTWSFNITSFGLTAAQVATISATETTSGTSTSEFAACYVSLPVSFIAFQATATPTNTVSISWSTAWEKNNNYFIIERSSDGINFTPIGKIQGKGTFNGNANYQFEDTEPLFGVNYYQLIQVDLNGQTSSAGVRSVSLNNNNIQIVQLPNGIRVISNETTTLTCIVYSELGQVLSRQNGELSNGNAQEFYYNGSEGVYFFCVQTPTQIITKKIPILKL
jgi:hypothetical protein